MSVSASDSPGEVVHCPNCKEDVPKTLYCLNCGYPLYKDGQKVEPDKPVAESATPTPPDQGDVELAVEPEEEAKPVKAVEPSEPILAPDEKPLEAVEPPKSTMVEVQPEPSAPLEIQEKALIPEVASVQSVEEKPQPEPEPMQVAPEPVLPTDSTTPRSSEPTVEVATMIDEYEEKAASSYVPDPLTKELMDSLAKNLSIRLKLLSLYRAGKVREETFIDLFEGYTAEGESFSQRREELLRKLNAELEEVERNYVDATEAMELMEIKRAIGDISEGEYTVKMPAYRWDIDTYDLKVAEYRNHIAYLENLPGVYKKEELQELRELASLQYNTVDALQISKEDSISTIKASLYEAVKILG